LIDLVAPPVCAACDSLLAHSAEGFCEACAPLVDALEDVPQSREMAACLYGGPLAEALARLKYRGRSDVAAALAHYLVERVQPWTGRVDRVCAVPLHPRRLRERGYNQSALLAWPVARSLGVPFDPQLVRRRRVTRNQVGLSLQERTSNVQDAFVANARARGLRVLVVDDVRTTGATMGAVSRALLAAGASEVWTLVLGQAEAAAQASPSSVLEC
jgi:ComF family protein